jgi:hypothetical protein
LLARVEEKVEAISGEGVRIDKLLISDEDVVGEDKEGTTSEGRKC